MAKTKYTRVPHVSANVKTEPKPMFQYEGCGFNPLRIIVKNSDGIEMPDRAITVVRGSREKFLKELRKMAAKQSSLEFSRHG